MNGLTASELGNREEEDFDAFLASFRENLRRALHVEGDLDELSMDRGLPPRVMDRIRANDPFTTFIPEEYGGRGGHVDEGLAVLATAAYESLPVSVIFAINWTLFLQPVTKYGREELKAPIFDRFLREKHMGGFMLTEPEFGSDALSIRTSYVEHEDHYHIQGTKHWGGLTGWADCWILAARERRGEELGRDIGLFVCDVTEPEQEIEVSEMYENLGLHMVPYGRNDIDVQVPKMHRLLPKSTGILMLVDLLHHSRTKFPGMGMGFLHRLLDEGLAHCRERYVGGDSLFSYDQVQERLTCLQGAYTVCSAMCVHASENARLENDLMRRSLEANAIKAVLTDLMQEASQSLLQLTGAKGYRLDHIAGRATVDSRPFQIFEGSNDILYHQITRCVLKEMKAHKQWNLRDHLTTVPLARRGAEFLGDHLSFRVDPEIPQRKQVQLGRILGRVVVLQMVLELGDRGFREDLIRGATSMLEGQVASLLGGYRHGGEEDVVAEYGAESAWRTFVEDGTS
jgi:alkylation response protein AidB-like acyl-CoA dehydrogenase